MADEFTLADFERIAPSTLEKAIIRTWREASPLMDLMKWKQQKALSVQYLRVNEVPNVPWRNIGESFTQTKIEPETLSERPYFMGAKIDIPKEYVENLDSLVDMRKIQEEAVVKGMAFGFNYALLRGDPTVDTKAPVGLWYRAINDLPAAQSLTGSALDISPDTSETSATGASKLFRLIEDLISRLDEGKADALIMNRSTKIALEHYMRVSGLLATTQDNIGRKFTTYGNGGPVLIDAGYKYDLSTAILPDTETDAGSAMTGDNATSIYAVRLGEPYLAGFYKSPIKVDDVGLLEDRLNYRTVVDWAPGIYMVNPRSIARLYDIVSA
jgi:hypothetical protein